MAAATSGLSSVVVLGKVQGAQVAEAQPHALHVEVVGLPLLSLQQVFDPVGPLLLKGNQLLFNLRQEQEVISATAFCLFLNSSSSLKGKCAQTDSEFSCLAVQVRQLVLIQLCPAVRAGATSYRQLQD